MAGCGAPMVRVVMQCRLSSSRLPAKAVLTMCEQPFVALCVKRTSNTGREVVVATSVDASDDAVAAAASAAGAKIVRGSLENVLGRYGMAAAGLPDDAVIVRLTADNCFPDGAFVDDLVAQLTERKLQYLGTCSPQDGLPYGMSAEAFTVRSLNEALANATEGPDREHVTPYIIRKYRKQFFKPKHALSGQMGHLRCTLDMYDDFLRLLQVFKDVSDPIHVPWFDLCELLARQTAAKQALLLPKVHNPRGFDSGAIVMGTVQLGMVYGATNRTGMPTQDQAIELVHAAFDQGVTDLDCARGYGTAETVLGVALKGRYANMRVVTKLGIPQELRQWVEKGGCDPSFVRLVVSAAAESSVLRSCRELGVPTIDTLLLHRWADHDWMGGMFWAKLKELQQAGLVTRLGASVYSPAEAVAALQDPSIVHLQIPFNVLDQRWKRPGSNPAQPSFVDAIAKRPDVVLHARSSLLQGILNHTSQLSSWPTLPEGSGPYNAAAAVSALDALATKLGRQNRTDLCFAYVRAHSWVHGVVLGMETVQQLKENCELFRQPLLSPAAVEEVDRAIAALHLPDTLLDPSKWVKPGAGAGAVAPQVTATLPLERLHSVEAHEVPALLRLDGRVAVVTGATGHLGRSMCKGLLGQGCFVYANARSKDTLDALLRDMAKDGFEGKIAAACFDVTNESQMAEFVERVKREKGRLDVLVNNAYHGGIRTAGDVDNATVVDFRASYELAVVASFRLCQLAKPLLVETARINPRAGVSVINISSMYASISPDPSIYAAGMANPPFYGAAKAALEQMTRYMACFLAHEGIRVNCISPGPFPPASIETSNPAFHKALCGKNPMRRIGYADELIGAIVFLASDASSYVTGADIAVDGGWTVFS